MNNTNQFRTPDFDALLNLQLEVPSEKRKPEFGLKLSKDMWSYVTFGNNGYYADRYNKWNINEQYSRGIIDNTKFKDQMGIDGNKSLLNIEMDPIKVIPRYVQAILGGFLSRDEKVTVKSTDASSRQIKENEKELARYRMAQKEKLDKLRAATNNQVPIDPGFTPEDDDDLDLYYKIEYRLPHEAFFEETTNQIMENSGKDYLKRKLCRDIMVTNLGVTKLVRLPGNDKTLSNRLRMVRCKPKNTIYNIFEQDNGSDISIIGEAYPLKISEARRTYKNITEEQLFELAQVSQKGLNQVEPLNWLDSYINAFNRPYDDYSILVYDYEVKVYDQEYYVKFKKEDGSEGIHQKKGRPAGSETSTPITNEKYNIYCGTWVVGTDIMLNWDTAYNVIRPFQNGVDCFLNYSAVYPDANGFYVPSLIERGIPCVRAMILLVLRINQMVALMEADGTSVDIAGLQGVDIGTGGDLQPLELMRVKWQTGVAYWNSEDDTGAGGDRRSSPWGNVPNNGNVAQVNMMIGLYNFWLERLNDEWGVNADSLGSKVPSKRSNGVNNNNIQAANNATEYIYDAYNELMEQNATKIGYILWDTIVFEGDEYKKMAGIPEELKPHEVTFDVNVNMVSKAADKERLMMMIQEAIAAKTLTPSQAMRIEMLPTKNAILYLEQMEKKASKKAMQMQKMNMQLNQQIQAESTKTKTEGKVQEIMATGKVKESVAKATGDANAYREVVKMVTTIYEESIASGERGALDKMLPLMEHIIQSTIQKKEQEDQAAAQEAQQKAMQQQQAAQQGQQPRMA